MVKIFTLDELVNQEIPTREDYKEAVAILRKEYETLAEEGHIYGALFYGSLFKNAGNGSLIGSDIDQIIVVSSMDDQTLNELRAVREKISNLRVPAEFHIFDLDIITEGYHGYERTFLDDLGIHAKGDSIIGNNVLDIIKPNGRTNYEIFRDRQIKNLRRLSRDVSAPKYSRIHCTFLGRIINYTIHLAKDTLHLKNGKPATEDGELLSKKQILGKYEAEFPQVDASPLRRVLDLREQFKGFLNNGPPYDSNRYKGLLDQIDSTYQIVQGFIRANLRIVNKMECTK
ncbi:hypothetical protein KY314_05135 [Candidatus Woesearchaeota archaeon]|nr:hypothetical protein [Candidatus Woesearchaeota archaeon]